MPNIASILKSEIGRVARKEVRGETLGLKKAVVAYRAEIAALKRRTEALEQELNRLSKARSERCASLSERGVFGTPAVQRKGPGLSAAAACAVGQ
jgi:DNA repair exonuclease SbcCD ATPase subunit